MRRTIFKKKFVYVISHADYRANTEHLFTKPVHEKIVLQGKRHLMHSIIYKYCPTSFFDLFHTDSHRNHNQNLRNNNDIYVPHHRIDLLILLMCSLLSTLPNNVQWAPKV